MTQSIGIVLIGRNEGERLVRCLASVRGHGNVVYVDSASSDDSVARAREAGADVVELDMTLPFTAARARNAGFARLRQAHPGVALVQFIDGDCELDPGWLPAARDALLGDPGIGIACGNLRELNPAGSIYNRLGDIEWRRPAGDTDHCGGIFIIRSDAFERVGGFDPSIAAGEEPDLCCRLRAAGMRVVRLDRQMATHDLNMMRLSQWWNRSVRGGYGALKLTMFGPAISRRIFRRQVISATVWGFAFPLLIMAIVTLATALGHVQTALLAAALGLGVFLIQALRIASKGRCAGLKVPDAAAYGFFTLLWKFAATAGFAQCLIDRLRGSRACTDAPAIRVFHKSA